MRLKCTNVNNKNGTPFFRNYCCLFSSNYIKTEAAQGGFISHLKNHIYLESVHFIYSNNINNWEAK